MPSWLQWQWLCNDCGKINEISNDHHEFVWISNGEIVRSVILVKCAPSVLTGNRPSGQCQKSYMELSWSVGPAEQLSNLMSEVEVIHF